MAPKILPALIILASACQALDQRLFSVTSVPSLFYNNGAMHSGNCGDLQGGISLNFSNVGLRRLGADFTDSPKVSCLSFEGNEIEEVSPQSFRLVEHLRYLSLARNRLDFANFSQLDGHPNLRVVVLDENRDVNLTEGPVLRFENTFHRLQTLYARDCGFRDVAPLTFAPHLTHLHLAANDLSASSLEFLQDKTASNLWSLDMSVNGLTRLDAGKLENLIELRLDGNRFERLCATPDCDSGSVLALAGMKQLRHLSLAGNAIASIETTAFDDCAMHLTVLDLSDNRIRSIEEGVFQKTTNLRNLTFKGNLLTAIPDIGRLEQLKYLSLAGNNLEVVRNGSLWKNAYIDVLDLSNNSIATIEHEAFMRQYYDLQILDLSNNKLTSLHLFSLPHLRVLYLNDNLLTSLDDLDLRQARNISRLSEVYLQNNGITKIDSHSHVFKRNVNIDFVLFDTANSTVPPKNAEECKCNCTSSSNDIDSLQSLEWSGK